MLRSGWGAVVWRVVRGFARREQAVLRQGRTVVWCGAEWGWHWVHDDGVVVVQVALAQGCSSGSQGLQERAAGALWGLSVSEANR